MIGNEHIFSALRRRRLTIGMLLAPLFVLNLIVADLVIGHAAQARALDDVVASSRCLSSPAPMVPENTPSKSDQKHPCPACATSCSTCCCVGPTLLGANASSGERRLAGSHDTARPSRFQPIVPAQFHSSLRAQAPPQLLSSQSFVV